MIRQILVVDDMSSVRHVIMALLKSYGYEATGASNGKLALDLLARRKFDLILSDWNMPGMTGTQLAAKIRAENQTVPIIMITAESDPKRVLELRDIGISGYLIKPFKPAALQAMLAKLFRPTV